MAWPSEILVAVRSISWRARSRELVEVADSEFLFRLRHEAEDVKQLLEAAPTTTAVDAVCMLSRQCVLLAFDHGLCFEVVAELACDGVAATAALLHPSLLELREHAVSVALESMSEALDDLKLDIFTCLRRLDERTQPRWTVNADMEGVRLVFGTSDASVSDVRLYRALNGACLWSLALAARLVGYSSFSAPCLWEFANVSHDCVVYAKGALCFQLDSFDVSQLSVPDDLRELRHVVLTAVLGLIVPDIAFLANPMPHDGSITIEEQNEILLSHHAGLAASCADCCLIDCLVAHPWASLTDSSHVVAFASFLGAFSVASVHPDASELTDTILAQIRQRSTDIWVILSLACPDTKDFAKACAALAYVAPPPKHARLVLLQSYFENPFGGRQQLLVDPWALVALIAFAANAGCSPCDDILSSTLAGLDSKSQARLCSRLEHWRGPVRALAVKPWMDLLSVHIGEVSEEEDRPLPAQVLQPTATRTAAPAPPAPSLRELARGAPPEFCCTLDGRILIDPISSPAGHIFERSVLVRALQGNGGLCPITGTPLTLEQCPRDKEMRKRIQQWVRVGCQRRR